MRCAGAPAVPAGSPPGRRFSQVWWPPESRSTVDMPAGRVTELQVREQQRREEKRVSGLCCGFLRQVVFFFFFSFTCCLLKHAAHAVHPPVLGQPLGRHLTLHPALVRQPQGLVHAHLPPVGGPRPVGRRLVLDCRVVQGLRSSQSGEGDAS